jgi:DNA-binding NarL/FixJ family response regulator
VVVADDQAVVRLAVRTALEADGIEVVAEAADAAAAVEATVRHEPDVCLLDLHMPGNGLWAARRIASSVPSTAVVMLTVADSDADLFDAVRSGVAGYLPKDTDLARLGAALEGVVHGETAMPRTYMTRLLGELREGGRTAKRAVPGRASVTITSREREVLQLLEHGLTTAEMARRLFVSPATVRTHVASLLRKFGVPDRAALLQAVGDRGETSTRD